MMRVPSLRRRVEKLLLPGRRRRLTLTLAGMSVIVLVATGTGIGLAETNFLGQFQVGQTTDKGQVVSSDQIISPYGDRLVINPGKLMSSVVSSDGTHMAASITDGGYAMAIVDLKNWKVQQLVGNNPAADLKIPGNDVGQEGPTYSPDGKSLWLGQSDGYRTFTVNPDGSVANPNFVSIPVVNGAHALVGAAVFTPDGSTVYSAVNGQNRVVAIDVASGAITQSWSVGIAPRGLALVGNKLYVSNEGGRPAKPGETTMNSYGTQVPANPKTGASTTGTVSVINTAVPSADVKSIDVGLHPTSLYAKKGALFVTDTASNDVSVIDTAKDTVVQTITTQPWAEATIGYEPTAVNLTSSGRLLVTLGRANAIAVYKYSSPQSPAVYVGLLPTDYYPAEIATTGNQIVVSNTRGIDARRSTTNVHGTHDTTSSLTHFTLPSDDVIRHLTGKVFDNNGWHGNALATAGKNDRNARPVPVPFKLGDPSTIKHVFLVVKENRTYDQVFGDMAQGNGDPSMVNYGENVTPNQHALAAQFGLYDNFYDVPTNSAEGHNWVTQADDPEYTESSAGEYTRSYDTENDVLGHQESGFIWTGVENAGKTVKDFGEFQSIEQKPANATWQNLYCDSKTMATTGAATQYPIKTGSAIPSLNSVSVQGFPLFDLNVPDVYKAQVWKQDFEKNGPANLNMFWLSNDHTGGPTTGPAQVADNDLALGEIVDTISHSKYWKDSAIFVVEDDSQAGVDHVDGHRAPVQIISPWAQHGAVDNTYYSQITLDRTIEQILGIKPMNQMDTAATPMRHAFTQRPNFAPFNAVPNRTSLTTGLKTLPSCGADVPAPADPSATPVPSTVVPAADHEVVTEWSAWKNGQAQNLSKPDRVNPVVMNHFDWYEAHDWQTPYPGETKVYDPNHVPNAAAGTDNDD